MRRSQFCSLTEVAKRRRRAGETEPLHRSNSGSTKITRGKARARPTQLISRVYQMRGRRPQPDQLSELAAIADPVPWRVQESARAAFRLQAAAPTTRVDPIGGQAGPADSDRRPQTAHHNERSVLAERGEQTSQRSSHTGRHAFLAGDEPTRAPASGEVRLS